MKVKIKRIDTKQTVTHCKTFVGFDQLWYIMPLNIQGIQRNFLYTKDKMGNQY